MKTQQSGNIKVLVDEEEDNQALQRTHEDSDSDACNVEETVAGIKEREKQIRESAETKKRFPYFVPSNSAWCLKPKKSWKYLSPHSKRILLQYARRAKRLGAHC